MMNEINLCERVSSTLDWLDSSLCSEYVPDAIQAVEELNKTLLKRRDINNRTYDIELCLQLILEQRGRNQKNLLDLVADKCTKEYSSFAQCALDFLNSLCSKYESQLSVKSKRRIVELCYKLSTLLLAFNKKVIAKSARLLIHALDENWIDDDTIRNILNYHSLRKAVSAAERTETSEAYAMLIYLCAIYINRYATSADDQRISPKEIAQFGRLLHYKLESIFTSKNNFVRKGSFYECKAINFHGRNYMSSLLVCGVLSGYKEFLARYYQLIGSNSAQLYSWILSAIRGFGRNYETRFYRMRRAALQLLAEHAEKFSVCFLANTIELEILYKSIIECLNHSHFPIVLNAADSLVKVARCVVTCSSLEMLIGLENLIRNTLSHVSFRVTVHSAAIQAMGVLSRKRQNVARYVIEAIDQLTTLSVKQVELLQDHLAYLVGALITSMSNDLENCDTIVWNALETKLIQLWLVYPVVRKQARESFRIVFWSTLCIAYQTQSPLILSTLDRVVEYAVDSTLRHTPQSNEEYQWPYDYLWDWSQPMQAPDSLVLPTLESQWIKNTFSYAQQHILSYITRCLTQMDLTLIENPDNADRVDMIPRSSTDYQTLERLVHFCSGWLHAYPVPADRCEIVVLDLIQLYQKEKNVTLLLRLLSYLIKPVSKQLLSEWDDTSLKTCQQFVKEIARGSKHVVSSSRETHIRFVLCFDSSFFASNSLRIETIKTALIHGYLSLILDSIQVESDKSLVPLLVHHLRTSTCASESIKRILQVLSRLGCDNITLSTVSASHLSRRTVTASIPFSIPFLESDVVVDLSSILNRAVSLTHVPEQDSELWSSSCEFVHSLVSLCLGLDDLDRGIECVALLLPTLFRLMHISHPVISELFTDLVKQLANYAASGVVPRFADAYIESVLTSPASASRCTAVLMEATLRKNDVAKIGKRLLQGALINATHSDQEVRLSACSALHHIIRVLRNDRDQTLHWSMYGPDICLALLGAMELGDGSDHVCEAALKAFMRASPCFGGDVGQEKIALSIFTRYMSHPLRQVRVSSWKIIKYLVPIQWWKRFLKKCQSTILSWFLQPNYATLEALAQWLQWIRTASLLQDNSRLTSIVSDNCEKPEFVANLKRQIHARPIDYYCGLGILNFLAQLPPQISILNHDFIRDFVVEMVLDPVERVSNINNDLMFTEIHNIAIAMIENLSGVDVESARITDICNRMLFDWCSYSPLRAPAMVRGLIALQQRKLVALSTIKALSKNFSEWVGRLLEHAPKLYSAQKRSARYILELCFQWTPPDEPVLLNDIILSSHSNARCVFDLSRDIILQRMTNIRLSDDILNRILSPGSLAHSVLLDSIHTCVRRSQIAPESSRRFLSQILDYLSQLSFSEMYPVQLYQVSLILLECSSLDNLVQWATFSSFATSVFSERMPARVQRSCFPLLRFLSGFVVNSLPYLCNLLLESRDSVQGSIFLEACLASGDFSVYSAILRLCMSGYVSASVIFEYKVVDQLSIDQSRNLVEHAIDFCNNELDSNAETVWISQHIIRCVFEKKSSFLDETVTATSTNLFLEWINEFPETSIRRTCAYWCLSGMNLTRLTREQRKALTSQCRGDWKKASCSWETSQSALAALCALLRSTQRPENDKAYLFCIPPSWDRFVDESRHALILEPNPSCLEIPADISLDLELDQFNQIPIMNPLMQLLDHITMDNFSTNLSNSLLKSARSSRKLSSHLLIIKLVLNRPKVFEHHAQMWFSWIIDVLCETPDPTASYGLHYMFRDTIELFKSWNYQPLGDAQTSSSRFISRLISSAGDQNNDSQAIEGLILYWKQQLGIAPLNLNSLTIKLHGFLDDDYRSSQVDHLLRSQIEGVLNQILMLSKHALLDAKSKQLVVDLLLRFHVIANKSKPIRSSAAALIGQLINAEQIYLDKVVAQLDSFLWARDKKIECISCLTQLGLRAACYPVIDVFVSRICEVLSHLSGEALANGLQIVLWRAKSFDDWTLCNVTLMRVFDQSHVPCHLLCLLIWIVRVPFANLSEIWEYLLNPHSEMLSLHKHEPCRTAFYRVIFAILDYRRDQVTPIQSEFLKHYALLAFSDSSPSIQELGVEHWNQEAFLKNEAAERIGDILQKIYSSETEHNFLRLSVHLLISPSLKSNRMHKAITSRGLLNEDMYHRVEWQNENVMVSQLGNPSSSLPLGHLRQTQRPQFSLTQRVRNFEANALELTQRAAQGLWNQTDVAEVSALPEKERKQPRNTVDVTQSRREQVQKRRRLRLVPLSQVVTEDKSTQMISESLADNVAMTRLHRQYRSGDLPDLQITPRNILISLLVLYHGDEMITNRFYVALFKSLYRQSTCNHAGVHYGIERIFRTTSGYTPLIKTLQECAILCCGTHIWSAADILSSAYLSKSFTCAILILEQNLLTLHENRVQRSESGKRVKLDPAETYEALSHLYSAIQQNDVVLTIHQTMYQDFPQIVACLERVYLENDLQDCLNHIDECLEIATPSRSMRNTLVDAKLKCLWKLGEYQELKTNIETFYPTIPAISPGNDLVAINRLEAVTELYFRVCLERASHEKLNSLINYESMKEKYPLECLTAFLLSSRGDSDTPNRVRYVYLERDRCLDSISKQLQTVSDSTALKWLRESPCLVEAQRYLENACLPCEKMNLQPFSVSSSRLARIIRMYYLTQFGFESQKDSLLESLIDYFLRSSQASNAKYLINWLESKDLVQKYTGHFEILQAFRNVKHMPTNENCRTCITTIELYSHSCSKVELCSFWSQLYYYYPQSSIRDKVVTALDELPTSQILVPLARVALFHETDQVKELLPLVCKSILIEVGNSSERELDQYLVRVLQLCCEDADLESQIFELWDKIPIQILEKCMYHVVQCRQSSTLNMIFKRLCEARPQQLYYALKFSGALFPPSFPCRIKETLDRFTHALTLIQLPQVSLIEWRDRISILVSEKDVSKAMEEYDKLLKYWKEWPGSLVCCGNLHLSIRKKFLKALPEADFRLMVEDGDVEQIDQCLHSLVQVASNTVSLRRLSPTLMSLKTSWRQTHEEDEEGEEVDEGDDHEDALSLELPGMGSNDRRVYIDSILPYGTVLSSLRRPIKLAMRGTDGKSYLWLVKTGDDLRGDQRVQRIFHDINQITESQYLETYNVIPLTSKFGLIEWVPDTVNLYRLIENEARNVNIDLNQSHIDYQNDLNNLVHSKIRDEPTEAFSSLKSTNMLDLTALVTPSYEKFSLVGRDTLLTASIQSTQRREIHEDQNNSLFSVLGDSGNQIDFSTLFDTMSHRVPSDLLRRALRETCTCPEDFLKYRRTFLQSYAYVSIASYLLGVGDRHPANFLIKKETGNIVAIDFGLVFGQAINLPIPELVPFRLTRQFTNIWSPLNTSTLLCRFMANFLRVLRSRSTSISNLLRIAAPDREYNAILQAKLYGVAPALLLRYQWDHLANSHVKSSYHASIRDLITSFCTGNHIWRPESTLDQQGLRTDPDDQASSLIELATSCPILGRAYPGWRPYL